MVEITLLEVHLDDATIDADATADAVTALPFSSVKTGDRGDAEAESEGDEASDSGRSLKPLLLVLAVVGLAVAAKKLLGGDAE